MRFQSFQRFFRLASEYLNEIPEVENFKGFDKNINLKDLYKISVKNKNKALKDYSDKEFTEILLKIIDYSGLKRYNERFYNGLFNEYKNFLLKRNTDIKYPTFMTYLNNVIKYELEIDDFRFSDKLTADIIIVNESEKDDIESFFIKRKIYFHTNESLKQKVFEYFNKYVKKSFKQKYEIPFTKHMSILTMLQEEIEECIKDTSETVYLNFYQRHLKEFYKHAKVSLSELYGINYEVHGDNTFLNNKSFPGISVSGKRFDTFNPFFLLDHIKKHIIFNIIDEKGQKVTLGFFRKYSEKIIEKAVEVSELFFFDNVTENFNPKKSYNVRYKNIETYFLLPRLQYYISSTYFNYHNLSIEEYHNPVSAVSEHLLPHILRTVIKNINDYFYIESLIEKLSRNLTSYRLRKKYDNFNLEKKQVLDTKTIEYFFKKMKNEGKNKKEAMFLFFDKLDEVKQIYNIETIKIENEKLNNIIINNKKEIK